MPQIEARYLSFLPQYTAMLFVPEAAAPARADGARVRMLAIEARLDKEGAILLKERQA